MERRAHSFQKGNQATFKELEIRKALGFSTET